MSFIRKLLGGNKRPNRPGPRPTLQRRPRDATPPATPTPPARQSPEELAPGPRRRYLEYVGGASSKFYAVILDSSPEGAWRVQFNFGRIGYPRSWASRIDGVPWSKAISAYTDLVDEKTGKGYEPRPWPAYLRLPDGSAAEVEDASEAEDASTLFRSARRGMLPSEKEGTVGGIGLPDGRLYTAEPEGGSRGEAPLIWASVAPVKGIGQIWSRLSTAFPETGIWPVVVDSAYGFTGFGDYLIDLPRGRHTEVTAILRKGWNDSVNFDEEYPDEEVAPFGRQFPGLADPTPGPRPTSLDHIVRELEGHLGLVAVNRPADVLDAIGWMGAANYDGDPLDMSTVLRSWEARFDAYLVGLGTETVTLAVGRPARDLSSAMAIAAEHLAFCPDNIQQGPGSIRDYAPALIDAELWPFWWD